MRGAANDSQLVWLSAYRQSQSSGFAKRHMGVGMVVDID